MSVSVNLSDALFAPDKQYELLKLLADDIEVLNGLPILSFLGTPCVYGKKSLDCQTVVKELRKVPVNSLAGAWVVLSMFYFFPLSREYVSRYTSRLADLYFNGFEKRYEESIMGVHHPSKTPLEFVLGEWVYISSLSK